MKFRKNILYLGLGMLVIFIAVSVLTFYKSNQLIEQGYLASEGSAARDFAVLTAANLHLSDRDVSALKDASYSEVQASDQNKMLKDMMDNDSFASKVDYAYVMVHLNENEVKYQVNDDNKDFFDAPIGTNLDILWLLDVTMDDEEAEADAESTADLQRYSYYIDADDEIFGKTPTYIYNSSEWGDHICGYAPLYSTNGTYIGAVGVELQTHDYDSYRSGAMRAMGLLLVVSTLTLSLLFFFLYYQNRKMQFEQIYTDSLTKISNRSYYNGPFIKRMNAVHLKGHCFVLLIADIDWFKKVNDTFGHEVGDQVLIEVSELLMHRFGKAHTIRFGGEEFVVGLWVENEAWIQNQLEQMYKDMAGRKFTDQQIDVSFSLGCSYYYTNEINGWLLSGMLRAADCNLYKCKENGRKQYRIEKYEETREYVKEADIS